MRRSVAAISIFAVLAVLMALAACGESDSADTTAPSEAPTAAATAPAAGDTAAPSAADGATVYADNCSGCHSADGSGGQGPNITGEDDVQEVTAQVQSGGSGMPAFGDTLSSEQIQAVTEYVTTQL